MKQFLSQTIFAVILFLSFYRINAQCPTINLTPSNPTCPFFFDGTITSTITGGTPPYTYTWSPGGSSQPDLIKVPAGTYTLFVVDAVNCGSSKTVTITDPIPVSITPPGSYSVCGGSSVTITITANGGTGSYNYFWSPPAGLSSTSSSVVLASPSSAETYIVTATDGLGCTATYSVFVDYIAPPLVDAATNNSSICNGSSATINSAGANTYTWNPGNLVGDSHNVSPSSTTIYTVVGTASSTGCNASSIVAIFVNPLPTLTIVSSPTVLCEGGTATLTANGASAYNWDPDELSGSSITVTPTISTIYTLTGFSAEDCINTTTISLAVVPFPTVTTNASNSICAGESYTLLAFGATTYTWNPGSIVGNSFSVSPLVTTVYTVTGSNLGDCSSSNSVSVSVIPSKEISGVLTNTAGPTGGNVILYKYTAGLSQWDSITAAPIAGAYVFSNIKSGQYVIRAIPTATNIQATYATSAISWKNATIINHGCINNTTQDITLIPLVSLPPGPGVLTGKIVEDVGYVKKISDEQKILVPGTPIGGIIVKGGKNPGGQMFTQTSTDAAGNYTLAGLPINTSSESYFISVDIPGLDTTSTYNLSLNSGNTTINGLDFKVGAKYINPIGSVTGISSDKSVAENKIILFPNPTKQNASIEYELTQSAFVRIDLYDILGNKVKVISENALEEKNKHQHFINIENLSAGIYLVKLKINNSYTTLKLVINP
ncbi:MAG: T9SS type A sorting domain-containing protein [Bacteroidota bacterium]